MTTSISNEPAMSAQDSVAVATPEIAVAPQLSPDAHSEPTMASRLIVLLLCLAIVLSALAFGTVHSWALAVFQIGAGLVVLLWMTDAWLTRVPAREPKCFAVAAAGADRARRGATAAFARCCGDRNIRRAANSVS
jgi:hypothetical protein